MVVSSNLTSDVQTAPAPWDQADQADEKLSRALRPEKGALKRALAACRGAAGATIGFSLVVNLLVFTSPLYMLQVYDRVLTSRNETTLVMLTALAAAMMLVMAVLEHLRSRVLVRAGARLDRQLSGKVFSAVFEAGSRNGNGGHGQALRDLDSVRDFVSGPGITTLCDAPWAPLFVAVAFLMHPLLGLVTLGGIVVILALAVANELLTRRSLQHANGEAVAAATFVETSLRNGEAVAAMGMVPGLARRWMERHERALALQAHAADRAGMLMALSKFVRLFLQSGILGLGAWLAIRGEITAGGIIACSIILGRALAPVEMAVGHWRGFVNARTAYGRLQALMGAVDVRPDPMQLPDPEGAVALDRVLAFAPGGKEPVLKGVTFSLQPGEVLGLVGSSGSGKSSLARVLCGVWPPAQGSVRLDHAELSQWSRERLGPHLGYLPQDVELFDGTVAENIARFGRMDAAAVVQAAQMAAVHEMILRLPDGYDTRVGASGHALSGGQRQRVGLARALYGSPRLVVLDEPNANLDVAGEQGLVRAVLGLKEKGCTTVVITHRMPILNAVDKIMVLNDGVMELFGDRDEIMNRLIRPVAVQSNPQIKAAGGVR